MFLDKNEILKKYLFIVFITVLWLSYLYEITIGEIGDVCDWM